MSDKYRVTVEYIKANTVISPTIDEVSFVELDRFAVRDTIDITIETRSILSLCQTARKALEKIHPGARYVRLVRAYPLPDSEGSPTGDDVTEK